MPDETPTPSAPIVKRAPDFVESYANNVLLETSLWDLKVLFGQLDQSVTPLQTIQKAAVTVSWAQAKLMAYFIQVNVLVHEAQYGPISLRKDVLPGDPAAALDGPDLTPEVRATIEQMKALYDSFMASIKIGG